MKIEEASFEILEFDLDVIQVISGLVEKRG